MEQKLKEIIEQNPNCKFKFYLTSGKDYTYNYTRGQIYASDNYICFPDDTSEVVINTKYIVSFEKLI